MKIIHVVPHIDQEAAGPSYSVPRLCQSLSAYGNEVELSCLAARNDISGVALDIHPQWPLFKRFAVSTSLSKKIARAAKNVDVIHNHSLWSMINIAAGLIVPGGKAKLVTSPRGTLSSYALSRSSGYKSILWPLQRSALARADMLHATSEMEINEIRSLGFHAPIVLLPNGVDLPSFSRTNIRRKKEFRTLLFLSRLHPKKGLDRLLQAWLLLQSKHPTWRLVIAGQGEHKHVIEIHELAEKLGLERVFFTGPVYGKFKSEEYFSADLFVLPTHSENFGMVVAEALAHGCPVVVSRGAPWESIERVGCGWWVDNDVPTLFSTLDFALNLPANQLAHMGELGKLWVEREFGWSSIGGKMDMAYRWLVGGGDCPSWVRVDI